jgi:hypothetical protein
VLVQLQLLQAGWVPVFIEPFLMRNCTRPCQAVSDSQTQGLPLLLLLHHVQVYSKATVSPTSSSQGVQEASSSIDLTVLEWLAAWGPQVQHSQKAGAGPAAVATVITPVSAGWFDFDWGSAAAS